MRYRFELMDEAAAQDIVTWRYESPYDLYNMEANQESIDELLNGTYFQMLDDSDRVVGYCCYGDSAIVPAGKEFGAYPDDGSVDVGLGLRPDRTGHGEGYEFFKAILTFLQQKFEVHRFRLTVATFNVRAIKLYETLDFKQVMRFHTNTSLEFMTMERSSKLATVL